MSGESSDSTPGRWNRIRAIFDEAVAAGGEQRASLLDSRCDGDADLRAEVESLLAAHDDAAESGDFFGAEDLPETVDRYRILRLIAKGGMGVVYLAEQSEPIRRQVAVKLIQVGMDTREVVARFELERQALALMSHPHIAQVLDAGSTDNGRPFFVMEHVPGVPITEYCDEHQMDLAGRLDLFLKVCDAIQHAHQKGVVHRDVKPSNVLVMRRDGETVPKVIDFGVAKATSLQLTRQTLFTRSGLVIGTPEYVSPEQASMTEVGIDTRTDVYSLGVLLYELLTGGLPFGKTSDPDTPLDEILRRIRTEDPVRPSSRLSGLGDAANSLAQSRRTDLKTLVGSLRGDLDWIVLRALEKDPTRRYPSASELAADVRRYMSDSPVEARPPSAMYRAGKFVRRHRAGVVVSAALLIAALGTSLLLAVQTRRISQERDRAGREAQTARAATDFLVEMFRQADPRGAGAKYVTADMILATGAREIKTSLEDEPEVRARLLAVLGSVHQSLSDFDTADTMLREALTIQEGVLGPEHPEVGSTLQHLAELLNELSKYQEAERVGRRAVAIAQRSFGQQSLEYGRALRPLAKTLREVERLDEGRSILERRLAIFETHPAAKPRDLADCLDEMDSFFQQMREPERGEPYIRRALAIVREELTDDHPAVAAKMGRLANNLSRQGRYDEAIELKWQATRALERTFGPVHNEVGFSYYNLAATHTNKGDTDEAMALLDRASAVWLAIFEPDHENMGYVHRLRGRIHALLGEYERAEEELRKAVEIDRKVWGEEHFNYVLARGRLGLVLFAQGRENEARPMLAGWQEYYRAASAKPDASRKTKLEYAHDLLNNRLEDLRDAATAVEVCLELRGMTDEPDTAVLSLLSEAYHANGQSDKAVTTMEELLVSLPADSAERDSYEQQLARFKEALR